MHIKREDIPRVSKSESESEEDDSDYEEEAHDKLGHIRTVSMIATGAQLETPRILPAKNRKSTLYENEKVFEEFDNQAIQVSYHFYVHVDVVLILSLKC